MTRNQFLPYFFFILCVTVPVFRLCTDCGGTHYLQQQISLDDHSVLVVSTVDGRLQGVNVETGEVIWSIKNPPLVSQSLSKLEFVKDNKKFRLIPSLEGQLYMLEIDGHDNGLRALPITADALFTSTFQLSSDALLVGGKDQRVFGFNPYTGEVKYQCGKDGCQQESSFTGNSHGRCELLVCRRMSHVVRAVDLDTGLEQWNFSVGQDEVISLDNDGGLGGVGKGHGESQGQQQQHQSNYYHHEQHQSPYPRTNSNSNKGNDNDSDNDNSNGNRNGMVTNRGCVVVKDDGYGYQGYNDGSSNDNGGRSRGGGGFRGAGEGGASSSSLSIRWQFQVEAGEVEAIMKPPFNRVLWKQRFASSLSRVWLVEGGTVRQLGLFLGDAKGRRVRDGISYEMGCPVRRSLYLGAFQGQMYVQLEDGSAYGAPRPRYVPLTTTNDGREGDGAAASPSSNRIVIDSQFSGKRQRVSRVTRHELTAHQRGFFRAPTKEMVPISDSWFVGKDNGDSGGFGLGDRRDAEGEEYFPPPSSEPLVVRYGSFLFQKIVLGCLVMVVSHLIVSNLYLPYYLKDSTTTTTTSTSSLSDACSSPQQPSLFHTPAASSLSPDHPSLSVTNGETEKRALFVKEPSANESNNNDIDRRPDCHYESRYATDFEHVRCLGRGAFGVVFEARHRVDQYRYAVKRVRVRYSEENRARLLKEVQSFAHLEHPGIVRYYQAWFEHPPPGWQEDRDHQIGLCLLGNEYGYDDFDDDESNNDQSDCTEKSADCSVSISEENSAAAIVKEDDDEDENDIIFSRGAADEQDSFVIFDRSLVLSTNEGVEKQEDEFSRQGISRGAGWRSPRSSAGAPACSHIYLYISMHLYSSRSLRDWLLEQQQHQQYLRVPSSRHRGNSDNDRNNNNSNNHDQTTENNNCFSFCSQSSSSRQRGAPMSVRLHIFAQIVDAVSYLHSNGLMHRDLKPSNILFDDHDHIRIVDFGLATSMFRHKTPISAVHPSAGDPPRTSANQISHHTMTLQQHQHQRNIGSSWTSVGSNQSEAVLTSNVGTELYMSPEQEQPGCQYDHKVDVFALGIIFIELVVPLTTAMERVVVLTQARNCKFDPDIWRSFPREVEFACRLLHHDPKKRPSCEEVFEHEILSDVVDQVRSPRPRTKSVDYQPHSDHDTTNS